MYPKGGLKRYSVNSTDAVPDRWSKEKKMNNQNQNQQKNQQNQNQNQNQQKNQAKQKNNQNGQNKKEQN